MIMKSRAIYLLIKLLFKSIKIPHNNQVKIYGYLHK